MKSKKNRRSFLKNTSLAALGVGIIPQLGQTKNASSEDIFIGGCEPTTLDLYGEGPFYSENPPLIENSQLANESEIGTKLIISGRVMNLACTAYLANVVIDVWHANDAGDYDNEGYNLRGQVTTNSEGFYLFETIKPGKYLNGGSFRPSHIHFKITPPEESTLTTQLYFEGDTDIPADAAASVTSGVYNASGRIISLIEEGDGTLNGVWDIVVDGDSTNSLHDIHMDKGVIYSTYPNPFIDEVTIKYGVFKTAKASLLVFDLQGRMVATLDESVMNPEKYEATWKPEPGLPDGHYFISLKINDLQVHYMKVLKKSGSSY